MPVAAEDHPGHQRLDHQRVQPGRVATRRAGRGRHGLGSRLGSTPSQGHRQHRARCGESPWAPMAPERTGPSTPVAGAERRHRASCPAGRSTTGSTSASRVRQRDRRSRCPGRRARRSRCRRTATRRSRSTSASRPWRRPPSRLSSAWTYCVPTTCRDCRGHARSASTAGSPSSAIIVSSPWIVDSAPEFWLTLPSGGDTVEGDAGGGVVRRSLGRRSRRRTTRPRSPASRSAWRHRRCASRFCTRESTPYAIWVASARAGSRPLSGPPEVSIHGSKVNDVALGDPSPRPVTGDVGRPRAARRSSASPRRASSDGTAPTGAHRRTASARASPPASSAMPSLSRASRAWPCPSRRRGRTPPARGPPRPRRRRRRRSARPAYGVRRC